MRRYGGYVSILAWFGRDRLAGAAFNQDKEQEIGKGDKVQSLLHGGLAKNTPMMTTPITVRKSALLEVYKTVNSSPVLNPEERFFKASGGQPVHIVANHSTFAKIYTWSMKAETLILTIHYQDHH